MAWNITFKIRLRTLLTATLCVTILGSSAVWAQCGSDACQGRCRYCVEGTCTPKRSTFGHYQSNWRRWPESPPPTQPCLEAESNRPDVRKDTSESDLELPEPIDEVDANPEFPHLRQKAGAYAPSELPKGNNLDEGSSDEGPESTTPAESMESPFDDEIILPDDLIDLPDPTSEGSSSRNDVPVPSRVFPLPTTVRHVDATNPSHVPYMINNSRPVATEPQLGDRPYNPLRPHQTAVPPRPVRPVRHTEAVNPARQLAHPLVQRPLVNPLR